MKKLVHILCVLLVCLFAIPAFAQTQHRNGNRTVSKIAITIDDGFDMQVYADFLDFAKQENIPFTFFVSGIAIKDFDAYGKLLQRTLDEGHILGSHSNVHKAMITWKTEEIIFQLKKWERKVEQALGYHFTPKYIRFPYGMSCHAPWLANYKQAMQAMQYQYAIYWDVILSDVEQMFQNIQNGSIVLLHTTAKDLRIFKELYPKLKEKGLQIVSLDELLQTE